MVVAGLAVVGTFSLVVSLEVALILIVVGSVDVDSVLVDDGLVFLFLCVVDLTVLVSRDLGRLVVIILLMVMGVSSMVVSKTPDSVEVVGVVVVDVELLLAAGLLEVVDGAAEVAITDGDVDVANDDSILCLILLRLSSLMSFLIAAELLTVDSAVAFGLPDCAGDGVVLLATRCLPWTVASRVSLILILLLSTLSTMVSPDDAFFFGTLDFSVVPGIGAVVLMVDVDGFLLIKVLFLFNSLCCCCCSVVVVTLGVVVANGVVVVRVVVKGLGGTVDTNLMRTAVLWLSSFVSSAT